MAYCRFASNSDLYVYESCYGGYQVVRRITQGNVSYLYYSAETRAELLTVLNTLYYEYMVDFPFNIVVNQLYQEAERNEPEPTWDGKFL